MGIMVVVITFMQQGLILLTYISLKFRESQMFIWALKTIDL